MIKAVYDNMLSTGNTTIFTIGIDDDVTGLSIPVKEKIETTPEGTIQCKFFGIGSDGTVGANKQAANIIGDNTNLYVQAYFSFDSRKSEGYTVSHLRFGKCPIQSAYLITEADYIACHKDSYVNKFDILEGIKPNGVFVLNSTWTLEDMEKELPAHMRREIANKNLKFYNVDAVKLASDVGLGVRINMIMKTAFFKLSNVLDFEEAVTLLKNDIKKIYEKEGDDVVKMNFTAVDRTTEIIQEIKYPESWKNAEDTPCIKTDEPEFITKIARPVLALKGYQLPVFVFSPHVFLLCGTPAYDIRRVYIVISFWFVDLCKSE